MLITDRFSGNNQLFTGNRLAELRRIPVGAVISRATAVITPLQANGSAGMSLDTVSFSAGETTGPNGETKVRNNVANGFEEISFHRRVTLSRISLTDTSNASLQVDIGGGTFVEVNSRGAFKAPGDADFSLGDGFTTLPSLEIAKLRVSQVATPMATITSITVANIPRNVSLAIGEGTPFLLNPGELVRPLTSIDFTDLLQASLADAEQESGFYRVPFNLATDGLARLALDITVEFTEQQSVIPRQLGSVKMPYQYNAVSEGEGTRLTLAIPEGARVVAAQTGAKIQGRFASSRIVEGSLDEANPSAPVVTISADNTQAQGFSILNTEAGEEIAVDSVDLLLTAKSPVARVKLDVRADLDGRPDSHSLLAAQPEIQISTDQAATPTWINLPLSQPIKLARGSGVNMLRYWLQVQSLDGECLWSLADGSGDNRSLLQYSRDGGLSWRTSVITAMETPAKAEFRLRQNTDTFRVPVEVKVGTGDASQRLGMRQFEPLGRIDFNLDGTELSNTINGYLQASQPVQPPAGEQLVNPEFDLELALPVFTLVGWEQIGPALGPGTSPLDSITIGDGDESDPSGISQTVPVAAGTRYELTVIAFITSADAKAELIWRGDNCTPTKTEELTIKRTKTSEGQRFNNVFRLRTTAPEGATQVEVRLVVPGQRVCIVDRVSLMASPQVLGNGDLLQESSDGIPGWTPSPEDAWDNGQLSSYTGNDGRLIFNDSDFLQPASLSQTVEVSAKQQYTLDFAGINSAQNGETGIPAVLLQFLATADSEPQTVAQFDVTSGAADQHTFAGTIPEGVTQARVLLVFPRHSRLTIRNLGFSLKNLQEVPIAFLSEAPGDLTVSDMRVGFAYEPVPPLPTPETGLCEATPANQAADDDCCQHSCCCYCPTCGHQAELKEPKRIDIAEYRTALVGVCADCGLPLYKNSSTMIQNTVTASRLVPIRPIDRSLTRISESAVPLTEVAYIGAVRAKRLTDNGISSINRLAAAESPALVELLDINEDLAESFIVQAKKLLLEEQLRKPAKIISAVDTGKTAVVSTRETATPK